MQRRFGIIAVAVVMFILTVIFGQTSITGKANPLYLAVWIMVGWYGYKDDLKSIASWMKWLIWIAIGATIFIYLFVGDNSNVISLDVKNSTAIGVAIMLVPKIALYYYCKMKINESNESKMTYADDSASINIKVANVQNNKGEDNINFDSSRKDTKISQIINESEFSNDEIFYEKALEEYDKGRRKGLWIKILSTNEGNETKSKFEYIRVRAKEIQIEHVELKKQKSILIDTARQEQIKKQLLLEEKIGKHKIIKINGENCFLLEDGKVLYQMKNGDYLIYWNEQQMSYWFEHRITGLGYIGILKKDEKLNI